MMIPLFLCLLLSTSQLTPKKNCLLLTFLFQISSISRVSCQCLNDQRSLLLQLKNTLIYNSSLSTKLVQWNQNIDCCNWYGVECDNIGNVIGLKLDRESIYGPIPSAIGNLSKLVNLSFANNFFTGSIPIFSMSNKLEHIDLSFNSFNGSLSSTHFEGLSNLKNLYLSFNSLTGNIPKSLFRLPSLLNLVLSNNRFSGQVNEFSALNSRLKNLFLDMNQLEGLIPRSFFRLEKLGHLGLSHNFFNGTIQLEDFQTLQNLKYLDLGFNHLSVNMKSVNSELSSFPQLYSLNLASCNLSRFPDLRNHTELQGLDLSNNKISGDIPSWIWEVGNLYSLNLSHNFLMNLQTPYQIPSSLNLLDLHSNMLGGELPVYPGSAWYVDYSSNEFEGHIPVDIGNFISHALFFSVANNNLIGEIPVSLCNAIELEVLDLSDNLLSGGLPPCLLTIHGVLNIGKNHISGNIPVSVSCNLHTLDLSNNNLQGNIPPSLARCNKLQVMNVASNNINDIFPCILTNSPNLHVLVLRNNKFFGDIGCREFNENWPNLQIIDIAFNSFTGFLDAGFVSSLAGMKLNNNLLGNGFLAGGDSYYQDKVTLTLKGQERELVKILRVYTCIDFSSNKFHGVIPNTIGELSSIYSLNLSHNFLIGTIPSSIGNLKNLESLDFSGNQLTGSIPIELASLTFLSFLNVSYNKLVGRIPSGSQLQTFSASSYEGNTGLCGSPISQSCPRGESSTSSGQKDWIFMFAGIGYAVGITLAVVPPLFNRQWGGRWEALQVKLLKLIFSGYKV